MLGAVLAISDVADLGQRTVALFHTFGEAIALFDRQGTLVYNSMEQRKIFQDWRGDDPLLAAALQTGTVQLGVLSLQVDDGAREKYIAARIPVPDVGWVAGGRRPVARAMAGVYTGLWVAGGINAARGSSLRHLGLENQRPLHRPTPWPPGPRKCHRPGRVRPCGRKHRR